MLITQHVSLCIVYISQHRCYGLLYASLTQIIITKHVSCCMPVWHRCWWLTIVYINLIQILMTQSLLLYASWRRCWWLTMLVWHRCWWLNKSPVVCQFDTMLMTQHCVCQSDTDVDNSCLLVYFGITCSRHEHRQRQYNVYTTQLCTNGWSLNATTQIQITQTINSNIKWNLQNASTLTKNKML